MSDRQRKLRGALCAVLAVCVAVGGCQLPGDYASHVHPGCSTCRHGQPGAVAGSGYLPPTVQQVGGQQPLDGKDAREPRHDERHPVPPGPHGPQDAPHASLGPLPVELAQSSHPPYTLSPPDILYIDTLRLVPRPPYRLEPLEQLQIVVSETLPNQPINGIFTVGPDGTINLGFSYGTVRVAGLTLDQLQAEIRRHLGNILRNPQVSVALVSIRGLQQTRGEHLVRPDGTISLGVYGTVYVAGLTLGQAKCVIESHLSKYFLNPQVSIDVAAYNSKKYYVVLDGGGFGQNVIPFPITGNETVLDAIANVQGLPPVASKRRIWVARPAPPGYGCYQILPVNWRAITEGGATDTNYQLFPGDRVVVMADKLIEFDNWLSKILAPVERLLGITLLTSSTINNFRNNGNNNSGFIVGGF